jgi:hypothetical protein
MDPTVAEAAVHGSGRHDMINLLGLRPRMAVGAMLSSLLLVLGVAGTAHAAGFSVSPSTGLSDNDVVSVTGTGYTAGTYKLGVCSKETYGVFGIPACDEGVEFTIDGTGVLDEDLTVLVENTNVHYTEVPPPFNVGQEPTFDCTVDACEVLLTRHNGTSSVTVDRQDISFS